MLVHEMMGIGWFRATLPIDIQFYDRLDHLRGLRQSILSSNGLNETAKEELVLAPEINATIVAPAITFYPNPVSADAFIKSSDAQTVKGMLYLVNATGQAIQTINIASANQKISFRHLASGVYFLKGTINETTVMQKFIKH